MAVLENQIDEIVRKVVKELKKTENTEISKGNKFGVFEDMNKAIEAAALAQKKFKDYSLEYREKIINSMREEIRKNIKYLSRLAFEETQMGRYEDKIKKNKLVIEKTPGVEDLKSEVFTGDNGLTLLELSPYGVIGAITPSTNPTETIICNSIGMIAAGNAVVFSPHPRAKNASITTIEILNEAIEKAGGPKNLIVTVSDPNIEKAQVMMEHEKIDMIVATGGPGVVKAALSSGKKAIGAGAGNPPVVVDETAEIEKAAKDIIEGCSFDNNLPCIAEKEVVVVDNVADYLIFCMKQNNALLIEDRKDLNRLEKLILEPDGKPNKDYIGKNVSYILKKAGIECEDSVKVAIMEVDKNHPFFKEELMMPILPIVRAKDVDEAIKMAIEAEGGNRHTAIMHSKNIDNLTRFAKEIKTTVFVKNGPSFAGIGFGGEGFTTFTIAGPTGEGLTSPRSFTRKRRCVLVGGFTIK
ncbi:aldehyde dehydrogenase family protein [Thermohalobacter berrensis]|uniref:Aldehyde dehydrogenase EutE n=1 Tax=Thermohalobacter berrensis TaxID=99594 RepID=A0A419T5N1_9FIRM|nr:aldehyde dehydrogenase family protein [Thermohalobacter berrensis]RKD32762.1 aldehyde dehydrogenase EutE [Thermohalobacter berrensis]